MIFFAAKKFIEKDLCVGAEVEDEVEYAEAGDEAELVGAYLPVGELTWFQRCGVFAERDVASRRLYVENVADDGFDTGIEADGASAGEVGVERRKPVGIEFEEGGAAVGAFERCEVDSPPVAMVAERDVGPAGRAARIGFRYRRGELKASARVGDSHAVDALAAFVERKSFGHYCVAGRRYVGIAFYGAGKFRRQNNSAPRLERPGRRVAVGGVRYSRRH